MYADIDHFGLADVWWADLVERTRPAATAIVVDRGDASTCPSVPAPRRCESTATASTCASSTTTAARACAASWTEPDGRAGRLDVFVALPDGHESLNVVIPWSDERFNFTSKHQARPATGELVGRRPPLGDRRRRRSTRGACSTSAGAGGPPEITWNWGGGAGRCGDHVVGLQFGAKWTEGTGFTENGLIVDGRLTKLGRELEWDYDWDEPMRPWRVVDPGGQLDVMLHAALRQAHRRCAGRD